MAPTFKKVDRWIFALGSLLSLVLISFASFGEDIYKVVDEDGNVTYSSEPPSSSQDTEVIQALPPPSTEDVEAARQRQQKIEADFEKLDQARAEQAFLEQEAQRQNNTSVIQNTTIVVGGPVHRHGHHPRFGHRPGFHPGIGRPGAPVAPGAPTAPGFHPPHAAPLPAGSHRKKRGP